MLSDTKVLVIKRSILTALAARDAGVARELFALAGYEVQRMRERVLMLIKTAQERAVGFLLEMAERVPAGNAIELPVSRQDIADYLGLTIERRSHPWKARQRSRCRRHGGALCCAIVPH